MITAKDDEQYDEGGMVAGMEQDFERVIAEKDKRIQDLENEVDLLKSNLSDLEIINQKLRSE